MELIPYSLNMLVSSLTIAIPSGPGEWHVGRWPTAVAASPRNPSLADGCQTERYSLRCAESEIRCPRTINRFLSEGNQVHINMNRIFRMTLLSPNVTAELFSPNLDVKVIGKSQIFLSGSICIVFCV